MHVITQSSVLFLWMITMTSVKSQECTLEQFLESTLYDEHFDTSNLDASYPPGKQVTVSCNVGYTGFFQLICVEGAWQARGTKCEQITCEIPVIENGFVHDKKLKYNEKDVLHFTSIKCRLSVALEGTSYDPAYRNVFSPGDTLRVNCGEKYWISQPEHTSAVTTCGEDGEWTIRPVCLEVRCSTRQPHVYRFSIYWGQIITLDQTVGYSCQRGYKSPDGRNLATCTRKGWRPDPLCQEITCEPKRFPDADPEEPFKDQYSNNERVRYTCKEGFTGQFILTCRGNSWNGSPGCTAITCDPKWFPDADPEEYFKYQYSYNEEVRYICMEGYYGEFTLKCGERGWIGSPRCAALAHCSSPPKVESAFILTDSKDEYSSGSEVTYHCHDNYTMVGENTIQCKNGTWQKKNINCTLSKLLRCGTPPFLEDGGYKYITKSHYDHNERVEYMCQLYYTIEGDRYKTCISGEWTGHMRCLKPCMAKEDNFRQHNITLKSNDREFFTHDEHIEFMCTTGVPVGEMALHQRCNSGVIYLPTCQ